MSLHPILHLKRFRLGVVLLERQALHTVVAARRGVLARPADQLVAVFRFA